MSSQILKFSDVSKSYTNLTLSSFSFELFPKDRLALLGPSGSGKTTIAKLIKGIITPSSGSIYYHNKLASSKDLLKTPKIQLVFQNAQQSFSPKATIQKMLNELFYYNSKVKTGMFTSDLEKLLTSLSLHSHLLEKYPHELSGGEIARFALVRALLAKPDVLICDEVLSSLDLQNQLELLTFLQTYQQKNSMAIVFITHDLSTVQSFCNRFLVVDTGSIVEIDSIDCSENPFVKDSLKALDWLN